MPLLAVGLLACGDDGAGTGGDDDDDDVLDGGMSAGDDDDDMAGDDDDDDGPPPGDCSPSEVVSVCGNDLSIVRLRAVLGEGMEPITGRLVANLFHYRLGGGVTGGVPHNSGTVDATISPDDVVEVQWDHCTGGEMWSEENCEYNLWVFMDRNGNGELEAGEPAGRVLTEISCFADQPICETVVLDCLDGMACAQFTDPPACSCAASCAGEGTPDRIITCS